MTEELVLHVNVPLMLRLLEFAREDSHSDLDLHFVTENLVKVSRGNEPLTMKDYKNIVEA